MQVSRSLFPLAGFVPLPGIGAQEQTRLEVVEVPSVCHIEFFLST